MIDIVSLGELLVDFAPAGERTYQANAGGAPANVLAAAARLGKKAACITMVGQDGFGDMLVKDLAAAAVLHWPLSAWMPRETVPLLLCAVQGQICFFQSMM